MANPNKKNNPKQKMPKSNKANKQKKKRKKRKKIRTKIKSLLFYGLLTMANNFRYA